MKSSKTSMTKLSSKKGNAADVTTRALLTIEYHKQTLLHDIKGWKEQLSAIEPGIDEIEKASKKEVALKTQELNKDFSNIKAKLDKINLETAAAQKRFNKVQAEFETKLLEPFTKEIFNVEYEVILNGNMAKIQAILKECQQLLNPIVEQSLNNTERLATLEVLIKRICLPDEFEAVAKTEEKLNMQMVALCKTTTNLSENSNIPEQCDPKKITTTLLQLFDAHRKGKQLLRQIQQNLHIDIPKEIKKETKETPVSPVKIDRP